METTQLLIFTWWGTVASKKCVIICPTKINLKKTCFDITCQILLHCRKEEREEKNEILQVRRRKDGTKKKGKIWCFLKVYLLRHKCLCLFRHKTFCYLNQIQHAAVHQRTTRYVQDSPSSPEGQWWKISSFFWKQCTRPYHARDLFSLGEMLICRLGTNASFLNLQHVNCFEQEGRIWLDMHYLPT